MRQMKVQLISYSFMLKEEFIMNIPTVTYGQVIGVLTVIFSLQEITHVVISNNKLIGIYTDVTYFEEMEEKNNAEKLDFLERNRTHKSSHGIFVFASSIASFLVEHKLMSITRFPSSSSSHSFFSGHMVSSRQTRK